MKKTIRTLTVMVIAILMLTIASIPAMAAGFDFETAIAEFSSNNMNTFTLEVGKTHTPTGALMAQQGMATCYSSDETIVTVSSTGTVTAVAEGTAYVAIDANGLSQVYRYDVVASGASNNNQIGLTPEQEALLEDSENKSNEMWDAFNDKANEMQQEFEEAEKENEQIFKDAQNNVKDMFKVVLAIIAVIVLLGIAASTYIFFAAPKCGMSRLWALVPLFSSLIGLLVFIVIRSNRKATGNSRTVVCPTCNGVHPEGTNECSICGTKLK